MKESVTFVPLFQTLSWIILLVSLLICFKAEIDGLRKLVIERFNKGSSLRVGPIEIGELKAEVSSVRRELGHINEKISGLFLATTSPAMYSNLQKLRDGNFGPYNKSGPLKRELYHLRDIGYIDVESITGIPETGPNLSDYVRVTQTGRLFIELREMVQRTN